MVSIIQQNALEAWRDASSYLLSQRREAHALLVEIEQPTYFDQQWLIDYNPQRYNANLNDLRKVIRTIFPYILWRQCETRTDLYQRYMRIYNASRNRSWGTYFQRLIDFKIQQRGGNGINQLENVIQKIISWPVRSKTALKMHISSPVLDVLRPRNGPCLQYLQFHVGDTLSMTAIYRNHDFTNKALGNYIGLGRLLDFVASEVGKAPGKLTCFSIHAEIPASIAFTKLLIRGN